MLFSTLTITPETLRNMTFQGISDSSPQGTLDLISRASVNFAAFDERRSRWMP
jgi:hypothetical protein